MIWLFPPTLAALLPPPHQKPQPPAGGRGLRLAAACPRRRSAHASRFHTVPRPGHPAVRFPLPSLSSALPSGPPQSLRRREGRVCTRTPFGQDTARLFRFRRCASAVAGEVQRARGSGGAGPFAARTRLLLALHYPCFFLRRSDGSMLRRPAWQVGPGGGLGALRGG